MKIMKIFIEKLFIYVVCLSITLMGELKCFAGVVSSSSGGGGGTGRSVSSSGGEGIGRSSSSAGGGGGIYSSDPTAYDEGAWESIQDYYDYLDLNGYEVPSDNKIIDNVKKSNVVNNNVKSNNTKNTNSVFINSSSIDIKDLQGYVPVFVANISAGINENISGSMVSNGINEKFIITSKNGISTSEYVKNWVIIQKANGNQGWYYFDENGNMVTGFLNEKDGNIYYLIEKGENRGMLVVGQVIINGQIYNFSDGNDGLPYGALKK